MTSYRLVYVDFLFASSSNGYKFTMVSFKLMGFWCITKLCTVLQRNEITLTKLVYFLSLYKLLVRLYYSVNEKQTSETNRCTGFMNSITWVNSIEYRRLTCSRYNSIHDINIMIQQTPLPPSLLSVNKG